MRACLDALLFGAKDCLQHVRTRTSAELDLGKAGDAETRSGARRMS